MATLRQRIEAVERKMKELSKYSPDCICFPEKDPPDFAWEIEREIARAVKCPLHGDRFEPLVHVYMAIWRRKKRFTTLWARHSDQYRKAWLASFPPDLWPAVEEEDEAGDTYLVLRDGRRLLVMRSLARPS